MRVVLGQGWIATRLVLVRICFAAALAVSLAPLLGEPRSARDGFVFAVGVAADAVAMLGPLVAAAIWGAYRDGNAEEAGLLFGLSQTRLRGTLLASGTLLLVAMAAGVVLIGSGLAVVAAEPERSFASPNQLTVRVVVLAATVVVVALWVPGVTLGLGTRAALAVALGAGLAYLLVQSAGSGPLALLRAALPTGALRILDEGREGVPYRLGVTAAVLLALNLGTAAYRLLAHPPLTTVERQRSPGGERTTRSRARVVALWLPACLGLGAVVPAGVVTWVPLDLRPSLALARLNGTAPDQVAQEYFAALRLRSPSILARTSVGDPLAGLGPSRTSLRRQFDGAFTLLHVDGLETASVRAMLGPVAACARLRYVDGSWRVVAVTPTC